MALSIVPGAFIVAGLSRVRQPGWSPAKIKNRRLTAVRSFWPGRAARLPDSGESGHDKSPERNRLG
ncbi:MAG: hypothetical protein EHM61_19310 [Acidobacteria bacterium]|nr:MAG: hypothetical protein EHM61_19310 [Acidobacteriota bacterium]